MGKHKIEKQNRLWNAIRGNGKISFSRDSERRIFFYLTLMMLVAGIFSRWI